MGDDDHAFWRLIQEAVAACGSEIAAIERYVDERRGTMSEEDRARIAHEIKKGVSGLNEPDRPFKPN